MKIRDYNVQTDYGVTWNMDNRPPEPAATPVLKEGDRWDCPSCHGDLFGIFHDGQLHIKYRERSAMVQGVVAVTCRRCGAASRISTAQMPITVDVESVDEILAGDDGDRVVADLAVPDVNASKWAIDYAHDHGIDLSTVMGSGKDGRIVLADVRPPVDAAQAF